MSVLEERRNLQAEIVSFEHSLNVARNRKNEAENNLKSYEQKERDFKEKKQRAASSSVYDTQQSVQGYAMAQLLNMAPDTMYKEDIDKAKKDVDDARKEESSIENRIEEYRTRLRDIDASLRKPEMKEERYKSLIERKNAAKEQANDVDIFTELMNEFRDMDKDGYEDAKAQAEECFELGRELSYNNFVNGKKELDSGKHGAPVPEHYKRLAKIFREMDGYKDTAELAKECDRQAEQCERREQERKDAEERKRRDAKEFEQQLRKEEERERLSRTVISMVLGGIGGGLFFVIVGALDDPSSPTAGFFYMLPLVGFPILLAGLAGWEWEGKSCGIGCGLAILVLILLGVCGTYFPITIFNVSGIIVGALTGYGIKKWKDWY